MVFQEEKIGTEIFKNIGDLTIESDDGIYGISGEDLIKRSSSLSLNKNQIEELLELLRIDNLITIEGVYESNYSIYLTADGFCTYAKNFIDTFSEKEKAIVSTICNKGEMNDEWISLETEISQSIVKLLLKTYEEKGYIIFDTGHMGGAKEIDEVTIIGKRRFREILGI